MEGVATPSHQEILARMRRIGGQVQGIERMIVEGRPCDEILLQLAALREAVHHAGLALVEQQLEHCVNEANQDPDALKKVVKTLLKFNS